MTTPQGHDDEHADHDDQRAVEDVEAELDHPTSEPPDDVDPTDPDAAGSAGS